MSLSENNENTDGMQSVFEMTVRSHHSADWIRMRLRIAKSLGRLEMAKRKDTTISGLVTWIPVYRIKEK